MIGIHPNLHATPHTEIDFLAMLRSVWRQRLLIGAVAVCCTITATMYAFSTTPEYEVSTVLRPAAMKDLDELNRTRVYSLPPNEALRRVGSALDSYDTRLGYFRSSSALQTAFMKNDRTLEQAFEDFNFKALRLIQPDPKKNNILKEFVGLEMRYPDGLDGKSILNGLVQYAIESERQQISKDLQVIIQNRIKEIEAKLEVARVDYSSSKDTRIAELLEADTLKRAKLNDELRALRLQLKVRRDNRIAQLNEAIGIARTLGLKRPSTPSSMGQIGIESAGNIIRTEVTNQQIPLYFMGTDALEAEQRALRNRNSDDFMEPRIAEIRKQLLLLENNRNVQVLQSRQNEELFLKGIEKLRAERARLASISTDMSALQLATVDRVAVDPISPIWPKKGMILILGLTVGCGLGIVLAMLRFVMLNTSSGVRTIEKVSSSTIESKGINKAIAIEQ
ncbi:Wzz/FepE/Etk N-terminal domain-containing protein [Pseudomonas guariconensis]|uniref:Wzz/FepE/Etk N-terminal domain-containing protein n=1 Tax=Pseudomonas guariconensis TaxID=1288410 RepID=UPI0018AA5C11|nr:Wzz/FepE/Etk N-terminal domain-containing protein [Pseudomonas guariconensis]MBF8742367.1 chain-length determining protein [Pseudomonas guariconensis]MBF8751522.1 chain-length determining protein [Pseudomonas guariconensis]